MLLAINWIEILVINEAKNVNKHSPIYNCLFFIWASFYVGLGPKFSIKKVHQLTLNCHISGPGMQFPKQIS